MNEKAIKSSPSVFALTLVMALTLLLTPLDWHSAAAAPTGNQNETPETKSVSTPIEDWVDVFNGERTAVIDSMFLSGNVHLAVHMWRSSPTEVRRLKIEAEPALFIGIRNPSL
jgi:hypothetical protein